MKFNFKNVDELTTAQDVSSWDRQRTNEELRSFVQRRLGQLALEKIN